MLCLTPFFMEESFIELPQSYSSCLHMIAAVGGSSTETGKIAFESALNLQQDLPYTPLIKLFVQSRAEDKPLEWLNDTYDWKNMRDTESAIVSIDAPNVEGFDPVYLAVYSLHYQVKLHAGLSIVTKIIGCVFLAVGTAIFSKMINDLVV